jgi:putative DNA primase/helicase
MVVARELMTERAYGGFHTLRHWRGGWMTWQGPHWAEAEQNSVKSWAYNRLEHAVYKQELKDGTVAPVPWDPNRRKIADVLAALQAITHRPGTSGTPQWDAEPLVLARRIVSCSNGLLDVSTRTLIPHTPGFFGLVSVPFGYQADAPAPARWLKFLDELWPGDPASVAALQEWFGYVLSGQTDLHKILLMVGPMRSGKGTIARVLSALVGKGHVAGPTLASLGTNFGLSPLLGKPLAVVSDARLSGTDNRQVVERLLSISGEDMLTVDRKYREPWSGTLPTRFVIISNELPQFGDASDAIVHRFVVLMMQRSWLGHENAALTAELLTELPGILQWALDGLDRLSRQGRLSEPESSADAVRALADLVSPVSAFVRDECEVGPEFSEPTDLIWARWKSWADDNGHQPKSRQWFGRDLRAVVPALRQIHPRGRDGRQIRHYRGLRLCRGNSGQIAASTRIKDPLMRTDADISPLLSVLGPCTRCGGQTIRYGSLGRPLCDECVAS